MRKILITLCLVSIVFVGAIPTKAQTSTPAGSPQSMLLTYYNRLNVHDFEGAFSLWFNPTQTFQDFVSGFADTNRITPYIGEMQPSNTNLEAGRIPSVLLGYHSDGNRVSYAGCVAISFDKDNWRILNADFQLISDKQFPNNPTIERYLSVDCYKGSPAIQATFTNPDNARAYAAIVAYYDLVNRKEFAKAYDMWLKPIPGPKPNGAPALDYRLPFTRFVDGYKDSGYIDIYLGDYNYGGASAGHSYLDGMLPAVLVDQHIDGSIITYYGCYVMGVLNDRSLGIVSGTFLPLVGTDVPAGQAILGALPPDCTQLNLQF